MFQRASNPNFPGKIAMKLTCISLSTGRSHLDHKISCYVCKGYEPRCTKATLKANEERYLKDCTGVGDRCMRISQKINDDKKFVESRCADERMCDEIEKVCDEVKSPYDCKVSCCHDDACNSADTSVNFSLCLVILCIAVGVIKALNFTWLHHNTPSWWQNEKNFRTQLISEKSLGRTDAFWDFDGRI